MYNKRLNEEVAISTEKLEGELNSNFKRWFGDSKVVDEQGNPLVCYHGSTVDIDEFNLDYSGNNTGNNIERVFYFTSDKETAITYSQQAHVRNREADYYDNGGTTDGWDDFVQKLEDEIGANPNINPCFLSIQNPYVYDADYTEFDYKRNYTIVCMLKGVGDIDYEYFDEGLQYELLEEWYDYDEDSGDYTLKPDCNFDGLIIKNVRDNITPQNTDYIDEYIVWDPNQIKSVYNKGLWSLTSDNVYENMSIEELNEELELLLEDNNELGRAIKLLDTLDNYVVTDPSFFGDFGKTFEKKLDKIHNLKTSAAKLKKAKELLLDASGELVDEQFDELHDEIDKFLFETNVYKFKTLKLNNGEILDKDNINGSKF